MLLLLWGGASTISQPSLPLPPHLRPWPRRKRLMTLFARRALEDVVVSCGSDGLGSPWT